MNIIGTGLTGLVGSRVVELLSPEFVFENLSLETGVDITHKEDVISRIEASSAPWIFHFAAKTDVEGAESERSMAEKSPSWIVNVCATEYIVDAAKKTGKKMLYISTDFIFDGTKDFYTEEDEPNPEGWYAKTKYEGEKRVNSLGEDALVLRIANPYRARHKSKSDFVHKILDRLTEGEEILTPVDQIFVPTFVDDIARAIKTLVLSDEHGIYHAVGNTALSPFQATEEIASIFHAPKDKIIRSTFADFSKEKAPRPFHAALKNDKISKLGVVMMNFHDGLTEVKKQEEFSKSL